MTAEGLYSDGWYSVADLNLSLSPSAEAQKQVVRDQTWYLLEDSYNNRFFRLTPQAYRFIVELDSRFTVDDIWERYSSAYPEDTPTQDEVIRLLHQLNSGNLLVTRNPLNSQNVFDRQRDKRRKELKGKLASFLFVRIPLFNPDPWLTRIRPTLRLMISWPVLVLWLGVVTWALTLVIQNHRDFLDQTQGILSPSNIFLLYVTLVILKIAHELGHAFINSRFGGSVPIMGMMLLLLTPIPYLDVSSSWSFRKPSERILVGLGGMLAELFIAALATIVWVNAGEGIVKAVAFNAMVIGSISSIIFNGNPLVKFDSYYILSDVLGIPNLYQRSRSMWLFWMERYLFGVKDHSNPALDKRESFWLGIYGSLSFLYRIFISISIILFVADHWMALGVILTGLFIWVWLIKPIRQLSSYLSSSPSLKFRRARAFFVTSILLIGILTLILIVPVQRSVKLRGVVKSENVESLFAPISARLESFKKKHGDLVKAGEVLATFSTRDLDLNILQIKAQLLEVDAQIVAARERRSIDLKVIEQKKILLEERLISFNEKINKAKLLAPKDGVFICIAWRDLYGTWMEEGQDLGELIPEGPRNFVTVAAQEDAQALFDQEFNEAEVMLIGQAGTILPVTNVKVIPFEERTLPSAVLGWSAGGDIAVQPDDPMGLKTKESFFKILAKLEAYDLKQDRSGWLRLELPAQPLGEQAIRSFQQILQKRYRF